MNANRRIKLVVLLSFAGVTSLMVVPALAQLTDVTRTPNPPGEGICKSFPQEVGAGRGTLNTPDSSLFIINRDPFRSIRRGRQVFQRKFGRSQGQGPAVQDGTGDIAGNTTIGQGLADSCATCHGRPRGSAGSGGDVFSRPDSRDAPHLFGLGLKEMLGDEITQELRAIRAKAIFEAQQCLCDVTKRLISKGISFGSITAHKDGTVDTSNVEGVNTDLRVRPFGLDGNFIAIREFVNAAFNVELGLQAVDPDTFNANNGATVVTPSGMELIGQFDKIASPPTNDPNADPDGDGVTNEIPTSIVDFEEHYLLNYFLAGTGPQNSTTELGRNLFSQVGCAICHVPDLEIKRDRRVATFDTVFDPVNGNPFNRLFVTVTPQFLVIDDPTAHPPLKLPKLQSFLARNLFTDFKRHDLGPNFHEIQFDGTLRKEFLTMALHGVGTTAPYGHDGRSHSLLEVILRHGGEAQGARDAFNALSTANKNALIAFLDSLVLFPPDDTPSTLQGTSPDCVGLQKTRDNLCNDPPLNPNILYPQCGHGSIKLTVLFNNPTDPE